MISADQKRAETFLRKQDEKLVTIAASLKSIDRSLQRIAIAMEKNDSIVDKLTEIGESYPVSREELANTEVKEVDNGRTSA